ncbi:hypothetical protein FHT32_001293 [Variovorax sp. SG517]|uniref:hypothetical protein n=1 Tax=Variovorax sp. SG517 TaxID=2587117 RepID=UPI00159E720D|nr:hypothetical protein [Variovorax sp. SG517]NVM87654.1 hypothetical protein [Variovorax sp. SG517]
MIQFFAAAAAVFVAYKFGKIQAGIAKQQADTAILAAKTARNKLKFELFERRLVMYDRVYAYIDTVIGQGKIVAESDSEFLTSVRAMGWITDRSVVDYVHKELRDKMIALSMLTTEIENMPVPNQARAELGIKKSVLQATLYQEHDALARVFEPFLKLEH